MISGLVAGSSKGDGKDKKEEDKYNLDAPDVLVIGEEDKKSDDDDTRRFTIKDFKEKAEKVKLFC